MSQRVLGFALVLFVVLSGQALFATQHCNTNDFSGSYGMVANGSVTVPALPITGPFRRAGLMQADGKGNMQVNTTASYNGLIFNEQITGTYQVSSDCSVTFYLTPFAPVFLPAQLNGFLSDNGKHLTFMIVQPPGQTISALVTRQNEGGGEGNGRGCSNNDLSKVYVLWMQGNTPNLQSPVPGQLPWEFVRAGTVSFDGRGNFSAQTTANYNGFLFQPENFTGTYSVAKDCSVTLQYTFQNTPNTWVGAVVDNGDGVDLIVSNPGVVINGTLEQQ